MATERDGDVPDAASAAAEADRRLATIRGLLAKAEATDFEHEAELFFNKASELIARWAIDEAQLWQGTERGGREQPDELQLVVHAPYLVQKAVLVAGVAKAHGCRSVRLSGGRGARSEIVSVVGFPSDLRWVETLVTSLLVQLTATMLKACPPGLSAAASASWRRSYIVGYSETVVARLEADRKRAVEDSGGRLAGAADTHDGTTRSEQPSVALVLASREREVEADYRRRYPRLRSSWASAGNSNAGRRAGRAAGRDAALTRGTIGARRALGR